MNPKISRLRAEREKNNGKIAALQTRSLLIFGFMFVSFLRD